MSLPFRFSLVASIVVASSTAAAQSAPDPCANLPTLPGEGGPSAGVTPTAATSATSATPTANTTSAEVSQQFLRCALARFGRQDYRQAIRYFDLANRAAPSADLHYNIGRSHELLNEYDEAATAYERYIRDKVNAPDRAEIEQRIVQLRDLARRRREAARQQDARALLTIIVDQPGARVFVDDRDVGASPLAPGLQLTPGSHRLRVEREGYQRWEGVVRARSGETGRAEVALTEATLFRTQPAPHIASFVLGGTGTAAIITGAVLGFVAANNARCDSGSGPGCVGMAPLDVANVTRTPCDAVQGLTCARDSMNTISTVVVSAGVGLLTGAVIAWFVEAGSGRTERVRVERARTAR
jgi:hypothetical protein